MRNFTRWVAALLAVTTLGAAGNLRAYNDLVRLTIDLPRAGCAAIDPSEQATVEAWPSEMYPGVGGGWAYAEAKTRHDSEII